MLFNDSALAVQVPHADAQAPLASATASTAHAEGWTWDIGLPARRGIGLVYSSGHTDSCMKDVTTMTRRLLGGLPRHRDLIQHIRAHGIPPAA